MLKIKRLGRRSFEVFRHGVPVGIVRFVREVREWSFQPYPSLGREGEATERRSSVLRDLLCAQGEYCRVDRGIQPSS